MNFDRNPAMCSCEGGSESFNGFKFGTFTGLFPRDGAASIAVKGLNYRTDDLRRNHTADHNKIAPCGMIRVFELN